MKWLWVLFAITASAVAQTNWPMQGPTTGTFNGDINIQAYGAVAGGCGVNVAANTAAFNRAVAVAAANNSPILIPATPLPFGISTIVIGSGKFPVSIHGQGFFANPFGDPFGTSFSASGSVLCSENTTGRIFTYVGNAGATTASLEKFMVEGPGVLASAPAITSCTESGDVGTCTGTGFAFTADEQANIYGNSIPSYNGEMTVLASPAPTSTSVSFYVRGQLTGLGTGTGGNARPDNTCLSIGDTGAGGSGYATGIKTYDIGGANCSVGVAVFAQDSAHIDQTMVPADYQDGIYLDAIPGSFYPNTLTFDGGIGTNEHIQFDMSQNGQNDILEKWDCEILSGAPFITDPTSACVNWMGSAGTVGPGNYYEAYGSTYAGDGVHMTASYNTTNNKVDGGNWGLGSGANADVEVDGKVAGSCNTCSAAQTHFDPRGGKIYNSAAHVFVLDSNTFGNTADGLDSCSQVTNNSGNPFYGTDTNGDVCGTAPVSDNRSISFGGSTYTNSLLTAAGLSSNPASNWNYWSNTLTHSSTGDTSGWSCYVHSTLTVGEPGPFPGTTSTLITSTAADEICDDAAPGGGTSLTASSPYAISGYVLGTVGGEQLQLAATGGGTLSQLITLANPPAWQLVCIPGISGTTFLNYTYLIQPQAAEAFYFYNAGTVAGSACVAPTYPTTSAQVTAATLITNSPDYHYNGNAVGAPGGLASVSQLPLTGTTGTITGTALTATCDSGPATVTGAAVGNTVTVSTTTGADVGGAFTVRGSVTSANTVTVYVCGTGTPSSLAYNVRVIQ